MGRQTTNDKRIAVVEDDPDINRLISYNLGMQGFQVSSVYDGREAMRMLQEQIFDIVILDIMLPGVDGFALCKAIRDNPDNFRTFIIVISAKSHEQDKLYAHILGADYYIVKPFKMSSLIGIVKEVHALRSRDFIVTKNR